MAIRHLRAVKEYLRKHGPASPWEIKNETHSAWASVREALEYLVHDEGSVVFVGKAGRNPNGRLYALKDDKREDGS